MVEQNHPVRVQGVIVQLLVVGEVDHPQGTFLLAAQLIHWAVVDASNLEIGTLKAHVDQVLPLKGSHSIDIGLQGEDVRFHLDGHQKVARLPFDRSMVLARLLVGQ